MYVLQLGWREQGAWFDTARKVLWRHQQPRPSAGQLASVCVCAGCVFVCQHWAVRASQ